MKTSVVIATFRRPERLGRCLAGIARQTLPPDEVLVAVRSDDDASRRVVAAAAETVAARVIDVGGANASGARNRCIAHSVGDVIAMLDDDAVPRAAWLARVVARFAADPSLGALGGPDWIDGIAVAAAERSTVIGRVQWCGRRIGRHHHGAREGRAVEWLKGANLSVRRASLDVPAFDERLRGRGAQFAEDLALTLRIKRGGWTVLYDPDVAVDHFPADVVRGDHRALGTPRDVAIAAHNETLALLDYLPPLRRAAFLAWAALVGTRLLPGVAAAVALLLAGHRGAIARCRAALEGRMAGWRTWRDHPAPPRRVAPFRMRICLVTHVVSRHDGQGRVNYELARRLAARGHAVTLVASAMDRDLAADPGIRWLRVAVPNGVPDPIRWLLFAAGAAWRIRGRLWGFDLIHVNGAIAPVPAHVNTVHFVHAAWAATTRPRRQPALRRAYHRLVTAACAWCERRSLRAPVAVVAVSEGVRRSLQRHLGLTSVRVIPTGVDPLEFHPRATDDPRPLRRELGLPDHVTMALFVGDARSPRKNLDLTLAGLADSRCDIHLVVVGDASGGPYPDLAVRLGVTARTHFVGPRSDLLQCYHSADVVICASRYEPASLVLLEAMACGLPTITTTAVGNAVFVEHGWNGFVLADADDRRGLARLLDALANDPGWRARIGRAARLSACEITWARMADSYEDLYRERIRHGSARAVPVAEVTA